MSLNPQKQTSLAQYLQASGLMPPMKVLLYLIYRRINERLHPKRHPTRHLNTLCLLRLKLGISLAWETIAFRASTSIRTPNVRSFLNMVASQIWAEEVFPNCQLYRR